MTLTLKKLVNQYWIAQVENFTQSFFEEIENKSPEFWTITHTSDEVSVVSKLPDHPAFMLGLRVE